jgi:putative transposase
VKQNFQASKPNELWFADISYISTRAGWMYLAAIIDAFSRKIVGWSMDKFQTTNLVKNALLNALRRQNPQNNLVLHSDRGKQSASRDYRNLCTSQGFLQSMSRAGNPYDNAMMESFFHTLKTEQTHWDNYKTIDEAKQKVFEYIEIFYNRKRLHSGIGYKSPIEFERAYFHT